MTWPDPRTEHLTIDGTPVAGEGTFRVLNPATGAPVGTAAACGPAQLDRAMAAAAAAWPAWRVDDDARRAALRALADVVRAADADLAPLLTAEQGKPLREAHQEFAAAQRWFAFHADLDDEPEPLPADTGGRRWRVVRRPLGVVAVLIPWNLPVALVALALAPALRAGNTVVLKPSPHAPLTALALAARLAAALPPGVLNALAGPEPLGAAMTAHPVPRKISFTGSTATGRLVAAAAAGDLKRVSLELGGNDPAIVLDDADPGRVAAGLFRSAFFNNGQACLAVKRVYVPRRLHGDLVEALAVLARDAVVGDGTDPATDLGPVTTRPQRDRVAGLVDDAIARGGTLAAGGHALPGPGLFYRPTVVSGLDDGDRLVDEEQFGPALPVVLYRDLDEVLRRADAGPYGLQASVWSPDHDRAATTAARLHCGQVSVNQHGVLRPDLPFCGHRQSGLGVRNGPWGLREHSDVQVLPELPALPPPREQPAGTGG